MSEIGKYLRLLRSAKKLSLKKVQDLTNLTNSRLSKIENGIIADPPVKDLLILSKLYDVRITELLVKAGYLTYNDYNLDNVLNNVSKLTEKEISYIQYTIDFLISNREDNSNDF